MTVLRFLIILLLMLNILALATIQGWLGTPAPSGEPERIANQLNPEHIRLSSETTTGAPVAAEPAEQTTAASPSADTSGQLTSEAMPSPPDPTPDPAREAEPPTLAATAPMPPAAAEPPPAEAASPPTVCQAWGGLSADEAERLSARLRRIGVTAARSRSETPDSWWVRIPPQRSRAEAEARVAELRILGVTDTYIVPEPGPTQFAVSLGVFKTESRARLLLGQLRERGVRNAGIEPRMTTTHRIQASLPVAQLRNVEQAVPGVGAKRQACSR